MDIEMLLGLKPPLCSPRSRVADVPVKAARTRKQLISHVARRNVLIEHMRMAGPEIVREIASKINVPEGIVRADLEALRDAGKVRSKRVSSSYVIWFVPAQCGTT